MTPLTRLVCLTYSAATLVACGTAGTNILPYQAPSADQPSVPLTVAPPFVPLSRHDSEHLSRHRVECRADGVAAAERMTLANWTAYSKERTPKVVAVPVGRVYFNYVRNGNKEACVMNFSARLETGHAYAMETRRTFGGFFKASQCLLSLVDSSSGEPVPLDYESAQPNFQSVCNKHQGERGTSVAAKN